MALNKRKGIVIKEGIVNWGQGSTDPIIINSKGVMSVQKITPKRKRKYVPPKGK